MATIGIDLGTTNSLAVCFRNDQVELIPNHFNEYLTPSVVSFDNGEVIIGKIAKERLVTHPDYTACLFKREMGKNTKYSLGNKMFTPEELSAFVVKQLIEDARNYLNEEIEEVVISVPAYFNARQRRATKKIGDLLNVKVERLINEPSAAAIRCRNNNEFETFIVFDFGGGTLDVSVVDCFDNVISICSIAGDNQLGGSDFDVAILNYFLKVNHLNISTLDKAKQSSLLLQAERVKIDLQTKETVTMVSRINQKEYQADFTKEILKSITGLIFDKIKKVITKAVKDSGFTVLEFSNFILVGGSSYMPIIQEYLTNLIKIPVIYTSDIDLLVAKGLGKYIGIKQRAESIKDIVVTDICPFSLSTGVHNPRDEDNLLNHVIIPRNTVLPTSKTTTLYAINVKQPTLRIQVFQGEAMYVRDNLYLGETTISLPTNSDKKEAVTITYSYDINSMLYVELKVLSTNEIHTFLVGDGNTLQKATNKHHLDSIKNISLKINRDPEIQLAIEKASRLYEESDEYYQKFIMGNLQSFQEAIAKSKNNLQRKIKMIEKFNVFLNQIENNIKLADDLDIFKNDLKDEEDDESNNSSGDLLS